MLLKETIEILKSLLNDCDLSEIVITEARIIAHSDPEKPEEWQAEYDILIKQNVCHGAIQEIDETLSNYDNVEMEATTDGLRIFEKER